MIKAVEVPFSHNDFLRRSIRIMFVMHHDGQPERILCIDSEDHNGQVFDVQGWFTDQEIWPNTPREVTPGADSDQLHTPYVITLDQQLLHALTELLTVRATGAPIDTHGRLVRDLDHERERRDTLEDVLIGLVRRQQ